MVTSSRTVKQFKLATPKQINARKVNWFRMQLKGIRAQLRHMNNEVNTRDHMKVLHLIEHLNGVMDYRVDEYNHRVKCDLEAIETSGGC